MWKVEWRVKDIQTAVAVECCDDARYLGRRGAAGRWTPVFAPCQHRARTQKDVPELEIRAQTETPRPRQNRAAAALLLGKKGSV